MFHNVEALLEHPLSSFDVFLLDLSGVVERGGVLIDGVVKSIETMKDRGPVFIVTNNAKETPDQISFRLLKMGLDIKSPYILSSAKMLASKEVTCLIRDKHVFVLGSFSSVDYVSSFGVRSVTTTLNEGVEAIVLMSSIPDKTFMDYQLKGIASYYELTNVPVLCCNPDEWVLDDHHNRYNVIGYYAKQLKKIYHVPVMFIGKPFSSFSLWVAAHLKKNFQIDVSVKTLFCDDRLENVMMFSKVLGLTGAWILKSGVSAKLDVNVELLDKGYPDRRLSFL